MPAALPWILAALAAKFYGTKKQKDRYTDIKRGRSQAFADAQAKKDKLTEEALAKAKDTRSKFDKKAVDEATGKEAEELTRVFSDMPRREFAATTPVRRGEPKVITNARNLADAKALRDINRYAGNTADLQALTGAFTSPEQMNTAMMNRSAIKEKARRQEQLARILGLKYGEISDPYSSDAQMANEFGDVLGMMAFA